MDKKEESFSFKVFFSLFAILGIIFLLVIRNWQIKTYVTITGIVTDQNVVSTLLPIETLDTLLKQKQVIIDQQLYRYQKIEIGENLFIENGHYYKEVKLQLELKEDLMILNHTFFLQIPLEEKFILRIFESCYKEE